MKLKDLEIHVGIERTSWDVSSKASSDSSPLVEAVRRVFQQYAKSNRFGDVRVYSYWLKSKLTHSQHKKRPHGMDNIIEASVNLCSSAFERGQNFEASRRNSEGIGIVNRPNYFFVGISKGMYDLNVHLSNRVLRMYRKRESASHMETSAVCIARGDLFPKFEVSMSPPVHVPVLRESYFEKTQHIAKHETYIRNEIEYDRYVSRRWYENEERRYGGTSLNEKETIMRAYTARTMPDSVSVNTRGLLRYQDALQSTCLAALGSLIRNEEEKVVAASLLGDGPRPCTATMNRLIGKWTLFESDNFEEFVRALNIGRTKRAIIESKMPFAQELEQGSEEDVLNVVIVSAESRMSYVLNVGSVETSSKTNILGDQASVTSRWSEDGSTLCEIQETKRGTIEMERFLETENDSDLMIVEYCFSGIVFTQRFRRQGYDKSRLTRRSGRLSKGSSSQRSGSGERRRNAATNRRSGSHW